jgi:hypothetical protein
MQYCSETVALRCVILLQLDVVALAAIASSSECLRAFTVLDDAQWSCLQLKDTVTGCILFI